MTGRCIIASNLIFITGGRGAGKTTKALEIASSYPKKLYIATAEITDPEMESKIKHHQEERDASYYTEEAPVEIARALFEKPEADVVIIDCITFWVNNLMYYNKDIPACFADFYTALERSARDVIVVSNEIGMSVIPGNKMVREYDRYLALANKGIASKACSVFFMVSGIPLKVK